jgi:hypothetical protein
VPRKALAINNKERSTVCNTDTAHSRGTLDTQARSTHTQAEGSSSRMQEDSKRRDNRSGGKHVVASQPLRQMQPEPLQRLFLRLRGCCGGH